MQGIEVLTELAEDPDDAPGFLEKLAQGLRQAREKGVEVSLQLEPVVFIKIPPHDPERTHEGFRRLVDCMNALGFRPIFNNKRSVWFQRR